MGGKLTEEKLQCHILKRHWIKSKIHTHIDTHTYGLSIISNYLLTLVSLSLSFLT